MKHYKQIIVNLLVDDDCEDEKFEKLAEEITEFVDDYNYFNENMASTRVNL